MYLNYSAAWWVVSQTKHGFDLVLPVKFFLFSKFLHCFLCITLNQLIFFDLVISLVIQEKYLRNTISSGSIFLPLI